jgi:hypothetical protein
MRLDPKVSIVGHRQIDVRNFLRELEGHGHAEAARRQLRGAAKLEELLSALREDGLIHWGTDGSHGRYDEPRWVLTDLGQRFCVAKAIKPLQRSKADRIVFDMLDRVHKAIDDDGQLYEAERLFLFGSYIQDTLDCGDIDVCFDPRPKAKFNGGKTTWPTSKEFDRHHRALIAHDGYRPRNMIEQLFYAQYKLRRAVKGRVAAISMHEIEDLKGTNFPFMVAYEAPGARALDWPRLKGTAPAYFDVNALAGRLKE